MIGVRCQKCGQVTYFDKRRVCTAKRATLRGILGDSDSSALLVMKAHQQNTLDYRW
jgi:hypothetical protein